MILAFPCEWKPTSPPGRALRLRLGQARQRPVLDHHAIVRSKHGIANFFILSLGSDSAGGGHCALHPPAPGWLLAVDHYFLRRGWGGGLHRRRGSPRTLFGRASRSKCFPGAGGFTNSSQPFWTIPQPAIMRNWPICTWRKGTTRAPASATKRRSPRAPPRPARSTAEGWPPHLWATSPRPCPILNAQSRKIPSTTFSAPPHCWPTLTPTPANQT